MSVRRESRKAIAKKLCASTDKHSAEEEGDQRKMVASLERRKLRAVGAERCLQAGGDEARGDGRRKVHAAGTRNGRKVGTQFRGRRDRKVLASFSRLITER